VTSTNDKARFPRRSAAPLASTGVLLAVVVGGCGGSGAGSNPMSDAAGAAHRHGPPAKAPATGYKRKAPTPKAENHSTSTTENRTPPAALERSGIPQHNGGDQDADNNGGPSDGDGNI